MSIINPTSSSSAIDAIIVPSGRTSSSLEYAVKLAQEAGCWLIVLCSQQASARAAQEMMDQANIRGLAADVPAYYSHPVFAGFVTADFADAVAFRESDLSLKRNLGLLIARLAGWQKVLFLDDDIRSLSASDLNRAARFLDQHKLAGFIAKDYPDNSVVRHAQRLSGVEPGVHLSGNALAVKIDETMGFFPNVYNEDWFFMHDHRKDAVKVGFISQQAYFPFTHPRRASSEEFGDVMAEGLVALEAAGIDGIKATETDWQAVLRGRSQLIHDISLRLDGKLDIPGPLRDSVREALQAAQARLTDIKPASCTRYIKFWRRDHELWQERLAKLERFPDLTPVMQELGLPTVSVDFIPQNR
jgi:hypothetical protein